MILSKYADFTDIFSSDFVAQLLEYTEINNYPLNLVKGQ